MAAKAAGADETKAGADRAFNKIAKRRQNKIFKREEAVSEEQAEKMIELLKAILDQLKEIERNTDNIASNVYNLAD